MIAGAAKVGRADSGDERATAARVDQSLAVELYAGATADSLAPLTDDATFLRRAHLDIVGVVPTPEELTAFALDPSEDKRERAIDRLLADDRYGRNWARYWRDVILYRRSDERALITASIVEDHLTAELNDNRPWDAIARGFIAAEGDIRENGATALIMAQMGQAAEVAAETSRIFLGMQIQCAQCHDHPTDRWTREQFHEFAAFFPRVVVRPKPDSQPRSFEVAGRDFQLQRRGPNAPEGMNRDIEHYMPDLENPTAKGQLMQPVLFTSGESLPLGVRDAERRGTLAEWLTARENPWFARALVNRMWSELVGQGFHEPVDDMGPDRTATAPETFDMLASGFATRRYDVKWLMKTIMLTDAYQRESRSRGEVATEPFAANRPQPLRADQLYDSLAAALGVAELGPTPRLRAPAGPRGPRGPRGEFSAVFGCDPSQTRAEITQSIPQALLLMNSPQLNQLASARRGSAIDEPLSTGASDEETIVELYLRVLSREPKDDELAICQRHVAQASERRAALEDVLWSLMNSTEFLYRK